MHFFANDNEISTFIIHFYSISQMFFCFDEFDRHFSLYRFPDKFYRFRSSE